MFLRSVLLDCSCSGARSACTHPPLLRPTPLSAQRDNSPTILHPSIPSSCASHQGLYVLPKYSAKAADSPHSCTIPLMLLRDFCASPQKVCTLSQQCCALQDAVKLPTPDSTILACYAPPHYASLHDYNDCTIF